MNERKHRIIHIMNRNISEEYKYSKDEIENAFLKKSYSLSTLREKIIYSRFFKECDIEDLSHLIEVFNLSEGNIKNIYKEIPERSFPGVTQVWDTYFKI